ncbi:hypothetical protein C5167_022064 [Papaver somniferum]|uniref:Uncharacterized protein n=1 Tax=Papaver somniferum TaxID=3469 RepID=A0A4Y7JKJ2_PAPSO|nr:hypothetical protein C5167_022064 [Papaver somniferum]
MGRAEPSSKKEMGDAQNKPAGVGGFMIGFGEHVFSILLLGFFFLEVYAVGYIPYVGKMLSFLLLSWMYAYYCFEYKWSLAEVSLEKRLDFFESNWAFFAGKPMCSSNFLLFSSCGQRSPGDTLSFATGSEADQGINCQRKKWMGVGLGRLPIFYAADILSMWALSYFRSAPQDRQKRRNFKKHDRLFIYVSLCATV